MRAETMRTASCPEDLEQPETMEPYEGSRGQDIEASNRNVDEFGPTTQHGVGAIVSQQTN
ncbi:hypothetical protein QCA50_008289 [Cerrena zonata]|uniref:Uncharacterized protein n=1 Tax=Cerrena zonata TaxID=2478898 RepID=A0AAW0GIF1_9APHY